MDLRKAKKLYYLLLGIFVILMLAMGITSNPVFGYLAIGVMAIYGIFHYFFWRCPRCGKNMGSLWVKCCPECGEKLS